MSYNPVFEASKALPLERIARELEDFAATGQDLSRRRFDRSPPPVPSIPSTGNESEPQSPGALLRRKEVMEMRKSTADEQYATQVHDEMDRIQAARGMGLLQQPIIGDRREAAEANVKYRWIQQGIWDDRWDSQSEPGETWKHEIQGSPLPERRDPMVNNLDIRDGHNHFNLEKKYEEVIQSAIDFQNRQLSRPCYQFVYQFCQERQWIKMGFGKESQDQADGLDTHAYQNVKARWIRDGIWDDDWSLIPGVSWKHERPRKIPPLDEMSREIDSRKVARLERTERLPHQYFMATAKPPLIRRNFGSTVSSKRASELGPMPPEFTQQSMAVPMTDIKSKVPDEYRERPFAKKTNVKATKIKRNRKPTQKKSNASSQSSSTKIGPVQNRNFEKEDLRSLVQQSKSKNRVSDARSSRPRRAAASEAIKKLSKAA